MNYVKGMVYDTEEDRIRYEDAYRKAWIAQCKVDAAVNPRVMLKLPEERKKQIQPENRPLNALGRTVNNLLKHKMGVPEISDSLEIAQSEIEIMIRKYGLPRDEKPRLNK